MFKRPIVVAATLLALFSTIGARSANVAAGESLELLPQYDYSMNLYPLITPARGEWQILDASPDGHVLLSAGGGFGRPSIMLGPIMAYSELPGFRPQFALGGKTVLTEDKGFIAYNSMSGEILKTYDLYKIAVFAKGTKVIAEDLFKSIEIINLKANVTEARIQKLLGSSLVEVQFSGDEKYAAIREVSGEAALIRIFRISDWQEIRDFTEWHHGGYYLNQDGSRLVYDDNVGPRNATVFDTRTGDKICRYDGLYNEMAGASASNFVLFASYTRTKSDKLYLVSFDNCNVDLEAAASGWRPRQVVNFDENRVLVGNGSDLLLLDLKNKTERRADTFVYNNETWRIMGTYIENLAKKVYVIAINPNIRLSDVRVFSLEVNQ